MCSLKKTFYWTAWLLSVLRLPYCSLRSHSSLPLSFSGTQLCWKSGFNQTITSPIHYRKPGDQLNGERINWIQARKPSLNVVWHGAAAAGKRDESKLKGEVCLCVCEREKLKWRTVIRCGTDGKPGSLRCCGMAGCLYWNRKRKWILKTGY